MPLVQKIRKRFPKLRGTPAASVWVQEAYKLLIVNKGIVLILVFALLIFPKLAQQNVYLSTDELYYKNYMQILSGELTPEKRILSTSGAAKFSRRAGGDNPYRTVISREQNYGNPACAIRATLSIYFNEAKTLSSVSCSITIISHNRAAAHLFTILAIKFI